MNLEFPLRVRRLHGFREIVLHVVTATATYAGDLDAAPELIGGKLHLVLTEQARRTVHQAPARLTGAAALHFATAE